MPTVKLTNREIDILQYAISIYQLYAGERDYTTEEEIILIEKLADSWDEKYCIAQNETTTQKEAEI